MAWGGDDDRRPDGDDGEEELDEAVRCISFHTTSVIL
jgi:hypothetical protein